MTDGEGGGETRPGTHQFRSFGRRQGRRLRPAQLELRERYLPGIAIALPESGALDPATLFPEPPQEIWLEIGFGGGEHLAALAARHPQVGFIGCEPFWNGVVKLLAVLEAQGAQNVRLWPNDVRPLLARLAPGSLRRVYILFPDPWPKSRHAERRLVSDLLLADLAKAMKPGAELLLASDHADYVTQMLSVMQRQQAFEWTAKGPEDFLNPPEGWVRTRYQEKTEAQGRKPTFLRYLRVGPAGEGSSPKVHSTA